MNNAQPLILLTVLICVLLVIAIAVLVYVLLTPGELMKRRRKGISISDGANVDDGRIEQNTSGLKELGYASETVVVSGNLKVRNDIYTVKLMSFDNQSVVTVPIDGYAILGRTHENNDKKFFAVTSSPYISREHCLISEVNGQLYVRDYHSNNHTYLNGKMITDNTPLQNNDILNLGGTEGFSVSLLYDSDRRDIKVSGKISRKVR